MKIDLYTKVCLTVIAFSLFTISIQQLIPSANAVGVQDVRVVNYATDMTPYAATLSVNCVNCR